MASPRKPSAKPRKAAAPTGKKKPATKTKSAQVSPAPLSHWQKAKKRTADFLARRPHRSFRRTLRRDYVRPLELPGHIAFSTAVFREIMKQRNSFLLLALLYTAISIGFIGIGSQAYFLELSDTLRETSGDIFGGAWGEIGKAGLLLLGTMNGNLTSSLTELQQFYAVLFFLLLWLTTVWLLRAGLAGNTIRLRDALYSSGGPIVPTLILAVLFLVQLLPAALAIIAYNAGVATGFLQGGAAAMVFAGAAGLLVTLSIYLVLSTFMAMVIITLPGMYPWPALIASGNLVTGRRVRLLLRLLWLFVILFVVWCLVMIPTIILSSWLQASFQGLAWLPIAPLVIIMLSSLTAIYSASYVYLLYRRVVEYDTKSA